MQCKHATNMHIRRNAYKIIGYLPIYISICIISENLTVTSVCLLKNFPMKRHHQVNNCSRTTYQEASSDVGSGWRSFPHWWGWNRRWARAASGRPASPSPQVLQELLNGLVELDACCLLRRSAVPESSPLLAPVGSCIQWHVNCRKCMCK